MRKEDEMLIAKGNDLKGQWSALWISFLTIIVMYIPYMAYTTKTTDIMEGLSLNYSMVGLLASLTALAGGLVLPFGGMLVDKWGAKNVIILGLIINSVGQLVFSFASSFEMLAFSRIVVGISVGLLFVGPITMTIRWFEQSSKMGVGLGILVTTDGLGTAGAVYLFSMILSYFGWRTGSVIGAIFPIIMLIISMVFLKEAPHFLNKSKSENNTGFLKDYLHVISNRNVITGGLFLVGLWGSYTIAVYWIPTILMDEKGWSAGLTAFIGASYALAGVISPLIFGPLSDKMDKRKPLVLMAGVGMTLSFVGFAIAFATGQYLLLAIMLPISGFFAYGGLPLCYAMSADSVGIKLSATANGFILSIGLLLGGFIYPLVIGYIKDITGDYLIGFSVAAVSLIILNVLIPILVSKDIKKGKDLKQLTA